MSLEEEVAAASSARTFGVGWGRGPTQQEENVVASDEPRVVSSCDVENLVCVASRQRRVTGKPAAGDTSTKKGEAPLTGAREHSGGGGG